MRVLVADDEAVARLMLKGVVSGWGHEVIEAVDGRRALDFLQAEKGPCVALIDWMMPGLTGPELCSSLAALPNRAMLYCILATARDGRDDVLTGLAAGADDYMTKPFDREMLKARLSVASRILDLQSRMRREERLQGVLDMAGAVCHEMNQPLQSVSGFAEILVSELPAGEPLRGTLLSIKGEIDRIGALTRRIMNITRADNRKYLGGEIVDIVRSSPGEF